MNWLPGRGRQGKIYPILESESNESGAVALAILLGFHGRHQSLNQLKGDCGISRDGSTTEKLVAAATIHGLLVERRAIPDRDGLLALHRSHGLPAILVEPGQRYSVLLKAQNNKLVVFDTARGSLQLDPDQLQAQELLLLTPGREFQAGGQPGSIWAVLRRLLQPLRGELTLLAVIAASSVVPLLLIAGGTSEFINSFLQQQRFSFGIPIAWLVLISVLIAVALNLFQNLLLRRLEYVLTRSFAADVFETAFSIDFSYYQERRNGELAGRMNFAMYIPNLVVSQFLSSCLEMGTGVLVILFSALISPTLFALLLAGFCFAALFNIWASGQLSVNNDVQAAEANQAASAGVQAIMNIESIKSSALEFNFLRDWQRHYLESIRQRQIIGKMQIKSALAVNGSIFAITAILLGAGGLLIIQGSLSLGSLLAFLFLQSQINNALYQIPEISSSWQAAEGMIRRHYDLASAPRDPYLRAFDRSSTLPIETDKLPGSIDLEGVSYSFSPVDPPYLQDLNIHIKPGEHLALVGGSGSGKSTVIRMLAGFYRPTAGDLHIGGRAWMEIPDTTLRASLAYVPQDVFVFNASFEDNIKLFRPGYSHTDVVEAAKAAALHDEVMAYSENYNKQLRDNGTNISGGQRQRMEIARALIKQPTILLLDEATSALDNRSEEHILSAVREMGITVVSVAHRLKAALNSDQVVVLNQGRVVEQGPPDELLARGSAFHRLVMAEAQHAQA